MNVCRSEFESVNQPPLIWGTRSASQMLRCPNRKPKTTKRAWCHGSKLTVEITGKRHMWPNYTPLSFSGKNNDLFVFEARVDDGCGGGYESPFVCVCVYCMFEINKTCEANCSSFQRSETPKHQTWESPFVWVYRGGSLLGLATHMDT